MDYSYALYVSALTQPSDASGARGVSRNCQRRSRNCARLSDEARRLNDVRARLSPGVAQAR